MSTRIPLFGIANCRETRRVPRSVSSTWFSVETLYETALLAHVKGVKVKEPDTGVLEVNAPRKKSDAEKQAEMDEAHRARKADVGPGWFGV